MSHAPRQRLQALYADDIDRIVRVVELSEGFIIQPVVVPNHDVAKAIVEELGARGIAAEWYPLDSEAAWLGLLGWLVEERGGAVSVVYSESTASATEEALQLLNQKRDSLWSAHARPLLWVTTPPLERLLWHYAPDLWSVASVPVHADARAIAPLLSEDPRQALEGLLVSLFAGDELRRFARFVGVRDSSLPDVSASMKDLAAAVCDGLSEMPKERFFRALERERPRRRPEIRRIAALFGVADEVTAPEALVLRGRRYVSDDGAILRVVRGPAGSLRAIKVAVPEPLDGEPAPQQLLAWIGQHGGATLALSIRSSDDSLLRGPGVWRTRLREIVGSSLRHWLGASRWLVVAVIDPLHPSRFCDPGEVSTPAEFAAFVEELLLGDLGEEVLRGLSVTLLVSAPATFSDALSERLRPRISVRWGVLDVMPALDDADR